MVKNGGNNPNIYEFNKKVHRDIGYINHFSLMFSHITPPLTGPYSAQELPSLGISITPSTSQIIGNLLGGTETEGDGEIEEVSCTLLSRRALVVRDNVVAGSWAEGFCIATDPCGTTTGNTGNEAHSCAHGFYTIRGHWCSELSYAHLWKNSYLGVFSMIHGHMHIHNSIFHDNHAAVNLIKTGYSRVSVYVRDSTIAGRSSLEMSRPCTDVTCVSYHGDPLFGRGNKCGDRGFETTATFTTASTGIILSQSRKFPKGKSGIPLLLRPLMTPLPYDKLGDVSYYGSAIVSNVTFRNFRSLGICGRDAVFRTMGQSRTHILPTEVLKAKWDNVDEDAKFFFHRSASQWRTGVQCGEGWDCSGLEMAVVRSSDGSLFGGGAVCSLLGSCEKPCYLS